MLPRRLWAMLGALWRRSRFEAGLSEEIEFHIQQRASDLTRLKGLAPDEAVRQARLEFGGREAVREECRRSFGLRYFDELRQDLGYAVRTLTRKPGFALVAIATLAVGIGSNSAMFSALDAVILKTLPVRAPEQLFVVRHESRIGLSQRFSWPFAQKLGAAVLPFGQAAAMTGINSMRLGTAFDAPRATVQLVSGDWFDVIGVQAMAGRLLGPDDNRTEGAHPVAVVSAAFWQQQFGGVGFSAGREVRINGYPFQIIGITPAAFRGVLLERPVDVWLPLVMQHQAGHRNNFSSSNAYPDRPWPAQDNIRWLEILVRSATPPAVLTALNSGLQFEIFKSASDETRRSARMRLEPFSRGFSNLRTEFGRHIYALDATVALVLLIVCANIANLLLARASERRREIAVRLSLGAGRGRVVRQMLAESLLLAGCGTAGGLVMAYWATGALSRAVTKVGATRLEFTLDWRVLAFTMGIALLAALLFGLLPALRATKLDPAPALKSGGREMHGGSRIRTAGLLIAGQVMLSVLLLSGAALFLRSLRNLVTLDAGFKASNLLSFHLDLDKDLKGGALAEYIHSLVDGVNAVPGVQSSAMAVCPLAADCTNSSTGFVVPGYAPESGEQITFQTEAVSPGYFSTAGMKLVSGRDITWRDGPGSTPVVVVNEALVRRYFAGRDPLGRVLSYPHEPDAVIVGVVKDARVNGLRKPALPMIWRSAAQQAFISRPNLHIRVDRDSAQLTGVLRRVIPEVDARARVAAVTSLPGQIELSLWRDYLLAGLTAAFGLIALFLACFGLYGVMSYAVSRRTAELGVRLALGAQPRRLLWQTMRESLTLVAMGIGAGIPLSLAAERLVHGLLFGVSPADPLPVVAAAGLLLASAALAAYLPASRAARVDPVVALRYE